MKVQHLTASGTERVVPVPLLNPGEGNCLLSSIDLTQDQLGSSRCAVAYFYVSPRNHITPYMSLWRTFVHDRWSGLKNTVDAQAVMWIRATDAKWI
jgi:hypothetical protein